MRMLLIRAVAAAAFAAALSVHVLPAAAQAPAAWTPDLMLTVKRVPAVVPSPDGTQVAFVVGEAVTEGERSEWVNHIHLAAADGSASRQLTRGDKSSSDPRWSPDGRWIAFISSRSGKANIWRISVSGGEAEQITDEKGGVSAFDWSPDGKSIAFVMRDAKSEAEEKADKEKRDWRTLDEQVKMNRLYVVPVEKGADGKRTARLLTQEARFGQRLLLGARRPDDRVRASEDAVADDWPSSDLAVGDGRRRRGDAAGGERRAPRIRPSIRRTARFIAFTVSDDPPVVGLRAARPRDARGRRHAARARRDARRAARHPRLVGRRTPDPGQRDARAPRAASWRCPSTASPRPSCSAATSR